MNCLELSRKLYNLARPVLEKYLPDILPRCAIGLVGEGSECLGFDDQISQDHDWGPTFCLWVSEETLLSEQKRIIDVFSLLPHSIEGIPVRIHQMDLTERTGLLSRAAFFRRFLGNKGLPSSLEEWRNIPEYHLCSCTNGEVFWDGDGEFSKIREALRWYPADIFLKKIAARCMIMAQAGQYNLPRSLRRGDLSAAFLASARFAESALSLTFLLNKKYMPFYKWATRACLELTFLGKETAQLVQNLAVTHWDNVDMGMSALDNIERHCYLIADELRSRNLTTVEGNWLWSLGPDIQRKIINNELRSLNVMED